MSQLPDERTPPSLREEIFQRIRQGVSLSESGHFTEAIHDALRPALRLAEELDRRTEGE